MIFDSDKSSCYVLVSITLLSCFEFGNGRDFATRKCDNLGPLQNDMRFFDRFTRQFIHWLQRDSPDEIRAILGRSTSTSGNQEIFKEVIGNWNNKTANVKSKIANCEWPFFLVCGILFLSAFATFIAGFAIILYKEFQSTNGEDKSVKKADKLGTDRYMFILAVVSCFLILTDVCLFISNNHLSKDLPYARETLISSVDELQNFQNSTVQELDHILRDDFDGEVSDSLKQFRALADCNNVGLHSVVTRRRVHFNKASESALSALHETKDILSRINMTLAALHGISSGLRSELGKMNLYFKEAKRLCSSSQQTISEDVCKKFVNEKDLFSRHLPQEVSNNVTAVASRLDEFLKHLNFSSVNEVLKSQEEIERYLCEERSGKLQELEKALFGFRIAKSFTLDTVKKYSNQLDEHILVPVRNKIQNAFGTDGNIGQYDRKRWWLSFVVIFVVLLASITTLFSLVLKQIEPLISRFPSNTTLTMELKTWFPLLPKRLFLSSTIVHLSMAVVLSLCAGMSFLVVSNMALVCEMSSHYEKLDDVFGTSNLLQDSRFFAKEKNSLKLFKKISECPEDGTLWAMLNLDEKFNINDSINRLNGIPTLARHFFHDSSVFDRRKGKKLRAFHKVLQEWKDIGLVNIDIKTLTEQVNNPLLDKPFQKLSEAVLSSYQPAANEHVTRTPFKMFRSFSNQASVIEDNYVKMNSVLSKLLNQHLKSFNKSRERVVTSFANMNDMYSDIASDMQNEDKFVDHQVKKTVEVIKSFMKDSISKMRNEVGKCGPVKHAYNQTVCLFCRDLFGSWNSWWILLLVCGIFTISSIILCFLTMKRTS